MLQHDLPHSLAMFFKLCILAVACSVAAALSATEAKDAISTLKDSVVSDHGRLQASLGDFGEVLSKLQEGTDRFIKEATVLNKNICLKGLSTGSAAIAKGGLCMGEALGKGVLDQALNQMNCFKVMGEYVVKYTKLGFEAARNVMNPGRLAEIVGEAVREEFDNHELVSQKLNHVWILQRTLMTDVGGCMSNVVDGMQTSRSLCGESPVETSDLPYSNAEDILNE